jgi:hypothetical protein
LSILFLLGVERMKGIRLDGQNKPGLDGQKEPGALQKVNHKEDGGQNHEVGVKEEQNSSMEEAPFFLEGAEAVDCAPGGEQCAEPEPGTGVRVRKAGGVVGESKREEGEENAAEEGWFARVEEICAGHVDKDAPQGLKPLVIYNCEFGPAEAVPFHEA